MIAQFAAQSDLLRSILLNWIKTNGPGIALCLSIALPAWMFGMLVPVVGGPVFSILLGMVVTLRIKDKCRLKPGISFTSKKILQYAVILLGFGMNLSVIASTGLRSLPIILSTICTSLMMAYILYRLIKIPTKISILIGVGSYFSHAGRAAGHVGLRVWPVCRNSDQRHVVCNSGGCGLGCDALFQCPGNGCGR